MIRIDDTHSDPPYEQLRAQVISLVANGTLHANSQLPSVRQMAGDLRISPATVVHAYQELERDGVIETRGRKGTFISSKVEVASDVQRNESLQAIAAEYLKQANSLGFSKDEAIEVLKEAGK